MRKLVQSITIAASLLVIGTVTVFADGGPHGGYTTTGNSEDKCAGCHRAHSGYARLLKSDGVYSLCMSCHDGSGVNYTKVDDGVLKGTSTALNGGAFVNGVTSIHSIAGAPSVTTTVSIVPDSTGPKTVSRNLTCVSCHDPHGRRWQSAGNATAIYNYGGSPPAGSVEQYRMLTGYSGVGSTVVVTSGESTKSYTTVAWVTGINAFCTSCHDQNLQGRDSTWGNTNGGVLKHPVGVTLADYSSDIVSRTITTTLPLEDPSANTIPGDAGKNTGTSADDKVVCLTCHRPHGVSSQMDGTYSSQVTPAANVYDSGPSYLLRFKNRGVCQDCHQK